MVFTGITKIDYWQLLNWQIVM